MLAALAATMSSPGGAGQLRGDDISVRSVIAYGAKGDGLTDDTQAFVRAINEEGCVFVPPAGRGYRITQTLALRRAGQRIFGCGALSRIFFDGSGANLLVTEYDDCAFAGLHLVPARLSPNLYDGWGIAVSKARRAIVRDCLFTGLKRGGVLLVDSDDCRVEANIFIDSLVRGDGRERQSDTGYDILMAGSASHNTISGNQCLSGVGVGIGCQTVARGKSQRGNIVRNNMVRNHPAYGIMVYLSDTHDRVEPDDRVEAITIESNDIGEISGAILTDGRTRFYGSGIYLQTTNDAIVRGNRIINTNTDRKLPFSGSAVPAAIAISGYGNAAVTGNVIDGCHHGVASIQTTARPRRGDGTLIGDNMIRSCDGAGLWLGDCTAATVHDNRLTATAGKGTHGILVRRFGSRWMDGYIIRGNSITDFAVGIEVAGEGIARAEIASNDIRGNRGNGIYTSAAISMVHHNQIEGQFGISINPNARAGSCRDNILRTQAAAIIDDGGSGVRVEDNIMAPGEKVQGGLASRLPAGAEPRVSAKRWYAKQESSGIVDIEGGYEGQMIVIVAHATFSIAHSTSIVLRDGATARIERGSAIELVRLNGRWCQT